MKLLENHLGIKTRADISGLPMPDELKDEIDQTFKAIDEFGYTGGDPSVIVPKDLGLNLGTVEEWVHKQNWSDMLHK